MGARDKPLYLTWSWKSSRCQPPESFPTSRHRCISFYTILSLFSSIFFLFHFVWRIAKIPKTATVTSPICQALRWARSPGHLCCFLFGFFFFFYRWTYWEGFFCFFVRAGQWALSSCQHTGNEDQKKCLLTLFWIFFSLSLSAFSPLRSITLCLPWTALIGETKCSKHTQSRGVPARNAETRIYCSLLRRDGRTRGLTESLPAPPSSALGWVIARRNLNKDNHR